MKKFAVGCMLVLIATFACSTGEDPGDITVPTPPEETTEATASAGGEEAEVNDHGTETFTDSNASFEMELDDFYFEPTNVKLPGGTTATIELHNEGDATHTFTSPGLDVDEELASGATKEIEVEIGTDTRYEFFCNFHRDRGMRGSFQPH
jgi:plastocyanin